jgi:hypothetical protein
MGKKNNKIACFGVLLGMVLPAVQVALADDNLIEINRVAAKVNNEIVTWGKLTEP